MIAASDWLATLPDVVRLPLWAAAGAAVGGVARHVLTTAVARVVPGPFPLGTLVVNVTGSALIGAAGALAVAGGPGLVGSPGWADGWALGVGGVLGGYTTVSSFALQVLDLMQARQRRLAMFYVLVSPVLCVGAAGLGWVVAAGLGWVLAAGLAP